MFMSAMILIRLITPLTIERGARWAAVRDLSESGVGLLTGFAVPAGSLLVLGLSAAHPRVARVVRVTPAAHGHYLLGCAFEDVTRTELGAESAD
jgi:hypothetical protein